MSRIPDKTEKKPEETPAIPENLKNLQDLLDTYDQDNPDFVVTDNIRIEGEDDTATDVD